MILQLIHNPASGTHDDFQLDVLAQAFRACGAKVRIGQTKMTGSLPVDQTCDLICVSGGDGTLRLVVAALIEKNISVPICVFPAGTVNLIARELGYASDPELFAREVMAGFVNGHGSRLHEPIATSDVGPFVSCLSAGPDGVAVATHSAKLKKRVGGMAYGISMLKLLTRWPKESFDLVLSDSTGHDHAVSCGAFYVIKSHHYAGYWSLVPQAQLGSNQFHLVALASAGRWKFIRFLAQVALGRDPAFLHFVETFVGTSLSIKTTKGGRNNQYFQIDGDPMDRSPATVHMTDRFVEYCLPHAD